MSHSALTSRDFWISSVYLEEGGRVVLVACSLARL